MRLIEPKDALLFLPPTFAPPPSFFFSVKRRGFGTRCDGCESISLVNVASSVDSAAHATPFVHRGYVRSVTKRGDLRKVPAFCHAATFGPTFVANES